MSTELQKHVTYQFIILTDTAYTPMPISIAMETDVDRAGEPVTLSSALRGKLGGPLVAVEVKDSKHGASHRWSLQKLRYHIILYPILTIPTSSPFPHPHHPHTLTIPVPPPFLHLHHPHTFTICRQRLVAMRSAYQTACGSEAPIPSSSLSQLGEDPFYDRCPWFQLVGRYYIIVGTLTCK